MLKPRLKLDVKLEWRKLHTNQQKKRWLLDRVSNSTKDTGKNTPLHPSIVLLLLFFIMRWLEVLWSQSVLNFTRWQKLTIVKLSLAYRPRDVRYSVNRLNVRLVSLLMHRGPHGEMNYLWTDVIKPVGPKLLCNIFNVLGTRSSTNHWEVLEEINSRDCHG